ncbi:Hypothetical predicted protein, partial [Paramuricea clavata]
MSFSLMDFDDVMSSKGSHTIGIVKGQESYDLLKNSFSDIFSVVNDIIKEGKIRVDDIDVPVEIFLGGDYKFLLLFLGMKGATSDERCHSCGVSFKVWEKNNANGGASGTYDFTSLMGTDKKLLLKNLPEKLDGVVKTDSSETVINPWKNSSELYTMLDKQEPSDDFVANYFEK